MISFTIFYRFFCCRPPGIFAIAAALALPAINPAGLLKNKGKNQAARTNDMFREVWHKLSVPDAVKRNDYSYKNARR